jgi:hypothetical protein
MRIKTFKLLIWLAHRVGYKSKLHLLRCPACAAPYFVIDSYLSFYLDSATDLNPAATKMALDISDAVIICRQCGEELEIKDAAVELIKLIVSSGSNWVRL